MQLDEATMAKLKKEILMDLSNAMRAKIYGQDTEEDVSGGYCEECGGKLANGICPACEGESGEEMDEEAAPEMPKRELKGLQIGVVVAKKPGAEMDMEMAPKRGKK